MLRLRGKYRSVTIINVHIPTEVPVFEAKRQFYEQTENQYSRILWLKIHKNSSAPLGKQCSKDPWFFSCNKHIQANSQGTWMVPNSKLCNK